jgi:hypothetical protein
MGVDARRLGDERTINAKPGFGSLLAGILFEDVYRYFPVERGQSPWQVQRVIRLRWATLPASDFGM